MGVHECTINKTQAGANLESRKDISKNEELQKGTFNQDELSDLIRDWDLSNKNLKLLSSRLKEKNCLASKTYVTRHTFYRNKDLEVDKYVISKEKE